MVRRITQDLIVTLQGDGWRYPQARMLVDDAGNAAVFVPPRGQPPVRTFSFEPQRFSAGRGRLDTDLGVVTYRRIGSSCGYALAMCNVKTPTLAKLWP